MTKLLEIREDIRNFYGRFEIYIQAAIKFLLSLISLSTINKSLGYMAQINKLPVTLLIGLLCTFLPINFTVFVLSGIILLHLSALSIEVCIVASCILLLMVFMYFRFAPDNGYNLLLTPLLFHFKIPQIMPITVGLLKEPFSVLSLNCGIIWYYFLKGIKANETLFNTVNEKDDKTSKFVLALNQIIENKEMFLVIIAFTITTLVVYFIRRLSLNHSWTVAIWVGNILNLVTMLLGYYVLESKADLLWLIIGMLVTFLVSFCIEFIMYNLEYSRIEKVQFEDDEYYYYVKAVPKTYLSTKDKKIKKIHSNEKVTINRNELAEELEINEELLK